MHFVWLHSTFRFRQGRMDPYSEYSCKIHWLSCFQLPGQELPAPVPMSVQPPVGLMFQPPPNNTLSIGSIDVNHHVGRVAQSSSREIQIERHRSQVAAQYSRFTVRLS